MEGSSGAGLWLPSPSNTLGSSPETHFLISSPHPSAEHPVLKGNLLPTLDFTILSNPPLNKHFIKRGQHSPCPHSKLNKEEVFLCE